MAEKSRQFTLLVSRITDLDDYGADEASDVIITPGKPADFEIRVNADDIDAAIGEMVEGNFYRRAVGRTVLEGSEEGADNHTLLEFMDALAPFFPRGNDRTNPDNMVNAFATRILQEGIKLGMQIQAGEIVPRKSTPPNPAAS